MTTKDREGGHVRQTVMQVKELLEQVPMIRIVINNGSVPLFAPMLAFYGIADRVTIAGDPDVAIGDAIVDTDGVENWALHLREAGDQ